MTFRIDIENAAGDKQGSGPLTNIQSLSRSRSLDKMGGITFTVPATDKKTTEIQAGRWYHVYHDTHGDLGRFRHASHSVSADSRTLTVQADDELISLMHKNCYWRRSYENTAVDTVVSGLLTLASWSGGTIDTGIGNTSVIFQGESVFEAIDLLRDRWGQHFRLAGTSTLDFGAFGDACGLRAVLPAAMPREARHNDSIAIITSLEITEESKAVVNRLIPVGGGTGTTQLTLEHVTSTAAGYSVQTGTNADSTSFWYIEDSTSQSTYGVIEKPFVRSDIAPLTNSGTSLENAANALYRAALAALLAWKDEQTHYSITVSKIDLTAVQPGDTIRVVYRGIAKHQQRDFEKIDYKWVDIDTDLHILDIGEQYNAEAEQIRLTVASTDSRRTADADIISQLVRDTKVFATHVQPTLTHSPVGPYVLRMDSSNTATFNIRLKDEVLAVNRVLMRFKTSPLRSSIETVAGNSQSSGPSLTTTSGPNNTETSGTENADHNHSFYIQNASGGIPVTLDISGLKANGAGGYIGTGGADNNHTHDMDHDHDIEHTHTFTPDISTTYGIHNDTTYPQGISVAINGTDRTSALGGTWAASNASVDVEVDITQYISRGQNNTVQFSCSSGQGEIEFLADCLLTIQAIVVT